MSESHEKKSTELSTLQKAALAYKKVRNELDQVISDPIAIIGMGCRLPGNVNSPEEFWQLLIENKDGIIEVPKNRWDIDEYYDPDKESPGKMYVRKGGFLQTPVDEFDADFFHISPKEAEDMDPQQRLALEVAYEALENAGIKPNELVHSATGVYMGICFNDYGHLITESGHLEAVDHYYSTGNHYSVLSGRISYFFGLEGPAISMDTACSSSLVTLDAAVKDLRLKRCNLALAGGVNLILAPEPTINFCKSGMLSPEGYCKTFDASADGYVRGEGCGIVVLKRLSDAIADKNTILAVIRGTAVNQDGASSGLTVPNGLAQEQVIKAALQNARISPENVSYVEAHGTGTSLGDPIELEALKNSYTKERPIDKPILVGSVKTNIGHTEAVAGVASIIKVVLSLLHEKIPATLHFKKLNSNVDLSNVPLEIASNNSEWKRGEKRLAGISSFGFSGTNAHVILEEGPVLTAQEFTDWQKRSRDTHQFHHRHYWSEAALPTYGKKLASVHPLLGEKYSTPDDEIIYRGELHLSALPYLKDHQVYKHIIYPGAGYLEMMLAAGLNGMGEGKIQLSQVSIEAALSFDEGKSVETQVIMKPTEAGYELAIYSQAQDASKENASWHCHARGAVQIGEIANAPEPLKIQDIKSRCEKTVNREDFYQQVNATGIHYGNQFQTLQTIYVGKAEALGELKLAESSKGYLAHPAILDGALQLLLVSILVEKSKDLYLPVGCDSLEFYAPLGDEIFVHWEETEKMEMGRVGNLAFCTASGKILAILRGMHYRKTTEPALRQMLAHESSVEDWLYEWSWEEKALEPTTVPDTLGHWLILSDGEASDGLGNLFKSKGATIHKISSPDHPKTKEEFVELLQSENFSGILHVSSIGDKTLLSANAISTAQTLSTKSALHLMQALAELDGVKKIPLFLITQDLFGKSSEFSEYSVLHSPLLGLFKSVLIERPELSLKLIDVGNEPNFDLVFQAIFSSHQEPLSSLRNSQFYVPRLLKAKNPRDEADQSVLEKKIRPDSTYLITGGLGGLGLALAKWLIEKGAGQIVLTGRRMLDDEIKSTLESLTTKLTRITYESIDIGDEKSVANLLGSLERQEKPLKGIFHLAGVLDDATLLDQDWNHFEKVFRPKVYGSYYLHQYSKELDLFVMFSSIASTLGNPGQSNYAAANSFMDSLCEYRKKQGLSAHSLSWGPWSEVGMAKTLTSRHAKGGFLGLNPKEGMDALEAALLFPQAHLSIAKINWKNYLSQLIQPPAWLDAFVGKTKSRDNLSAKLEMLSVSERFDAVANYVEDVVRAVLSVPASQVIDRKKGFFDMGFDSLMAIELKNRLQMALGKSAILASTTVFDYASIDKMTQHLAELLKLDSIKIKKHELPLMSVRSDEPIAIIGMSCRYPGGANNPEEFWRVLEMGIDGICEVPKDRFDVDDYYDPILDTPGKMYTRNGGFLNVPVDLFDANFFGISPKEAEEMDPQQRLLLEVTWEALEHACIPQETLEGTNTGLYAGIMYNDYSQLITKSNDPAAIGSYFGSGNAFSAAVGRVSYCLGLQGPCMAIDTACSSSLVAINSACESLRLGECQQAIAGGVSLMLAPGSFVGACQAHMLSPDGHCKTFDKSADGYARAEGCGMIVLKRVSDAKRDGDKIYALIRSSGVNHGGATSGLTVPNGKAQEALLRHVYGEVGLKPDDIDYVEAHGTGTSLGDPIEVRAIGAAYGDRHPDRPLLLGSAKSNIGHTESAAGVAGVIKMILSLNHEMLPANLHFTELNPNIELNFPVKIVTEKMPWKKGDRIRRAGVSSFGFSGVNAHVIVEEAPEIELKISEVEERPFHILTLSAKTEPALNALIQNYEHFLETTEASLADICYSANTGRNHELYRIAVIAKDVAELKTKLRTSEFTRAKSQKSKVYEFSATGDWAKDLNELAMAYANGVVVDWKKFDEAYTRQKIALPTYPFQREHYWAEAALPTYGKKLTSVHPLLGEKYSTPDDEIIYRGELHLSALPYLKDHQVYKHIIYPGAGYLEMMLAAGLNGIGEGTIQLSQVSIEAALSFDAGKSVETQVIMRPSEAGYELAIYSQAQDASKENASWHCHARGAVRIGEMLTAPATLEIEDIKSRCKKIVNRENFYEQINATGIHYGNQFQTLQTIYVGQAEALGELKLAESSKGYLAHPAILDGALQLLLVSILGEKSKDLYLPVGCDSLVLYSPLGDEVLVYWQETEKTEMGRSGNLTFCTASGIILAKLTGMHYRKTTELALRQMLAHESSVEDWLYEWSWEEKALEPTTIPDTLGHWLILSDGEASDGLGNLFESKGASTRRISSADHPNTKEDFVELLQSENFTGILHVSSTSDEAPLSADLISSAQNLSTKSILHLTQALIQLEESLKIPLFLITKNLLGIELSETAVLNSPLLGLFKTILSEHPELSLRLIDRNADTNSTLLLNSIFSQVNESILALRSNRSYVPRFLKAHDAKLKRHELIRPVDDQFRLQSKQKGLLENLTLAPLELKTELGPREVEVDIRAVGVNFRDVLDALGLYPGEPGPLGGDGAGVITRVGEAVTRLKTGDVVMGMISGALSRKAWVHEDTVTQKPENLSFAEASALPTVFLTTYYAFTRSTVLKKGETVLIHAGAGGVGQAAIQLAKWIGARIIATAGGAEKQAYLRAQGIEHVLDSRSLSFGKDIEAITKGEGVDVVLNSLTGEGFIETSVGICKKGARFLEIAKRDIWTKEEMKQKRPDIDYHIIALDDIAQNQPNIVQEMLKELMPLFQKNILKSMPITTFPIEEAIQAFEYMQAAKHIGKVVIELPPGASIENKIHANATYLITGGLGGLGLTLAKWLIEKGATNLVLTGRRKWDDEIQTTLNNIKIEKTKITYESMDIGDEKSVANLLSVLEKNEKPLKGIFHLAGILEDATLVEQDWNHFENVFRPKVYGSYYLHQYSKELDLFVMFSSIASSLGNPGQSNYAAANAFIDALCEYRKQKGLAALSVSWGPWAEVGMAKELVSRHAKGGMLGLKPNDGMRALEAALLSSQAHITVANINWKNFIKQMIEAPSWLSAFVQEKISKDNLLGQLETALPEERANLVKIYVADTVKSVLGLSSSQSVDEKKGFFDMGLDSLMAIELKNRLQVGLGKAAILATTAVFDHSNVEKMTNYLGHLLKIDSLQVRKKEEIITSIQPDEPIAIIGMACRFPGGANNPKAYWELLERGGDAITEIPRNRWDADQYYDPDPEALGKMITKLGGFLDVDVSEFDAAFFNISPKEAEYLDPQQRLLLEVSYEAIQSAGIDLNTLEGTSTGVFVGICSSDYMDLITETGNKALINPYIATGNAASTATGRISYFFGLQGPNFAVDTACSSSLVAIDEACKNLRTGDANLALAGGVNLILSPNLTIDFSKAGMLAFDGHCKTFDSSADGYVRGEGCGMIVLKRLSDAKRDGNTILAIIESSAVNQDGASSGLTVPNGDAQERLIQKTLSKAKLKGADIDYVEAHGTGTSLGDPIEVRAIGATYGARDSENPLKLGSVKTNIGHLEGAAGIAGVIKVILALQHETLPKHLHFTKLNPHIDLNFPAEIITENKQWKRGERIRRAAVSSFGFSGTNAHLIIEEGPELSEEASSELQQRLNNKPLFQRERYWVRALDEAKQDKAKLKLDSWFYRVEWMENSNIEKAKNLISERHYYVFTTQSNFEAIFKSEHQSSTLIKPNNALRSKEEFINILKGKSNITDIVYASDFDSSGEALLALIQAIVKVGLTPKIWILSLEAQSVTGNEHKLNPSQSVLLGFAKVIALEHPEFRCVRIDYDDSVRPEKLLEEFSGDGKEDEITIRENKRYVPRLTQYTPSLKKEFIISPETSYLITGGLGGLGLACVDWLIEKGAKHLILTGRSAAKEAVQARLDEWQKQGIFITLVRSDVSQQSDVELLFQTIHQNHPELKGIIHAAGIADNDFITQQSWERFSKVLAPKVDGTRNLGEALKAQKIQLDFFVLFSSVSGVLGSASASTYAAGNYYLHEYAKQARKEGLPVISIAWGPWRDIGMAAGEEEKESRLGYGLISFQEGLKALEIALRDDETCPIIAPMNWPTYFQNLQYVAAIYSSVKLNQIKPTIMMVDELGLILDSAKHEDRLMIIIEYLRGIVRNVMGLGTKEKIDDKKGFFDMGMDSLMATELRNKLQNALGDRCILKPTVAFNYPTAEKLATHIGFQLGYNKLGGIEESENTVTEQDKKDQEEIKRKIENATEQDLMDELRRQIKMGEEDE